MDTIVGMMFAKNEVDILPLTITKAMSRVDTMFIADDGSDDGSWEVIQYYKYAYPDKIEYIRQAPVSGDQGQRNCLLDEIRRRYKAENTWVQTIEADIVLYTDGIRETIEKNKRDDISVNWHCMNAVREDWTDIHRFYPFWPEDIQKIMPRFHWTEEFSAYTFRPLPGLFYETNWRPWPRGFAQYYSPGYKRKRRSRMLTEDVPFALHYGYRGPTHLMTKWNKLKVKPENPTRKYGYDYTNVDTLMKTFTCFNGVYNRSKNTGVTPEEAWEKRG